MPPKTAKQLREQIEEQQDQPFEEGKERTAEGMETRTPSRREFFSNLEKLARRRPGRESG